MMDEEQQRRGGFRTGPERQQSCYALDEMSMKTLQIALSTLIVGGVLGGFLMWAYDAKERYTEGLASIQQVAVEMRLNAEFDLLLLEELEENQPDKAKSFVARRVASYYQAFHDSKFLSPETQELMRCIDASKERLPTLRDALQKER